MLPQRGKGRAAGIHIGLARIGPNLKLPVQGTQASLAQGGFQRLEEPVSGLDQASHANDTPNAQHHEDRGQGAAHRLGLTVLHDADKRVAREYATDTLPMTLLIDQHGRVREVYTSYRSNDEDDYRSAVERLLGATAASDRGTR